MNNPLLNPLMQKALGLEVPEPEQPTPTISLPVVVEPQELPKPVENPALPDMTDIDRRSIEGEKQLEEMIHLGQKFVRNLVDDELPKTPSNLRRGIVEQISVMYTSTLNAIIHKNELQLKKRKERKSDAAFQKKDKSGGGGVTNMFFGTREQMMAELENSGLIEDKS